MTYEAALLKRYAELTKSTEAEDGTSKNYVPHEPHPKQQEFLNLTCKEALYGGAAGGGKSDALLMAALQYVHVPGYSALLLRKTYTDLSLSNALLDRANDWLQGTDAHWDGIKHRWVFPTGAKLSFGYMDNPKAHLRYKSSEFQFVGFDQVEEHILKQYLYLYSRLRRTEGLKVPLRMRGTANPGDVGHDWVQERFGIPEEIDFSRQYESDGRVFLPAKLEDNPSIPEDYEESLMELDEVTYQQLRHGAWIRDSGELVYKFEKRRNVIETMPVLADKEQWHYIFGSDFGVTDPTAYATLAYAEHDPRVIVVESEQWTNLAPSDAGEVALAWEERYKYNRMMGDVGGLGKAYDAEFRQRCYVPLHPAQKQNKLGYIKLLNGDLEKGKLLILRGGNEQLISDISKLMWKDEKHQQEHPLMPNHLTDAVLYAWREAKHWAWSERKKKPAYGSEEWAQKYVEDRQEKLREQIERENNQEWWEEYADA